MTTEIKYHTKELALKAVAQNGRNLEFCSPELQNDEDIVGLAIKKYPKSFQYASGALQSNKIFIMKAIFNGVEPWYLIQYSNVHIKSDIEVMSLAVEKSHHCLVFKHAEGKVALNKELAAKSLLKSKQSRIDLSIILWQALHPTLQEFFPKDSFHEKSQAYLYQLEQEKQAELVAGGCKDEDGVVW